MIQLLTRESDVYKHDTTVYGRDEANISGNWDSSGLLSESENDSIICDETGEGLSVSENILVLDSFHSQHDNKNENENRSNNPINEEENHPLK